MQVRPSAAAPLTDEDIAIFESAKDITLMLFAKASYGEYFHFFSRELQRAVTECEGVL
jgi:hypothetical protein